MQKKMEKKRVGGENARIKPRKRMHNTCLAILEEMEDM